MRLERFKDAIIPLEGILYAQYASNDYEDAASKFMEQDTTRIYFFSPNAPDIVRNVTFKGDCLDEFGEWFAKFKTDNEPIKSTFYSFPPTVVEPVLKFSPGVRTGQDAVIDGPVHTLTITHTDGTQETTVLDGPNKETSDAETNIE